MAKDRSIVRDDLSLYSRDTSLPRYQEFQAGKQKRRNVVTVLLVVIVALLVATATVAFAYINSVSTRLAAPERITSELREALAPTPEPQDPFYMLLIGHDLEDGGVARSDTIILARVDPPEKSITLISIPRDTRVDIPGHGKQKINAAFAYGGPELTVRTVSEFADVPITHYVEVDFDEFKSIVEVLGGVEVDVKERVYHELIPVPPIEPGLQTLDAAQAMNYVQLRNYPDGDYRRMEHQRIFLKAIAQKMQSMDPVTAIRLINEVADMVNTDLTLGEIVDLYRQFGGMDMDDMHQAVVPSHPEMIDQLSYVVPETRAWERMMDRVKDGLPPTDEKTSDTPSSKEEKKSLSREERGKVSIAVKNGSDISGAAKDTSEILGKKGYKQGLYGNFEEHKDDTIILYRKTEHEAAAQDVIQLLGQGHIQVAGDDYEFDDDILVIIGSDWSKSKIAE